MNRLLLLIFFAFSFSAIQAQEHNHEYCGTHGQDHTWLRKFQQHPELFPMPEDDLIVAALQVHNVGNNGGSGFFHIESMLTALCRLQEGFSEADIQFYLVDDINYIANTNWNTHETFGTGSQLMSFNKVPNALNTFVTSEAAGNCGYYSPGQDACVVAKSCAGPTDHTWAHELGHYLSLPHPFVGWEGIEYDPNVPTVNYQNQVWGGIEKLDGSNCNSAGDGFCDTAPDYLSDRWTCNSLEVSPEILTDTNGEEFQVDGTLIMSYSNGICKNRFSDQQIAAMRANLTFQRPNVILDVEIETVDETEFSPIHPQTGDVVPYNYLDLEWEPIAGATHYYIQIKWEPWGLRVFEKVVESSNVIVTELDPNKNYSYTIRPFNYGYFCAGTTEEITFETSSTTAVNELEEVSEIKVYPTILNQGTYLNVEFQSAINIENANLTITSLTGIRQSVEQVRVISGLNRFEVLPENLTAGIYFVSIETEEGSFYEKFVVQ